MIGTGRPTGEIRLQRGQFVALCVEAGITLQSRHAHRHFLGQQGAIGHGLFELGLAEAAHVLGLQFRPPRHHHIAPAVFHVGQPRVADVAFKAPQRRQCCLYHGQYLLERQRNQHVDLLQGFVLLGQQR
ncbi:hypothetical protein D3C71_1487250 [compost metagenome]